MDFVIEVIILCFELVLWSSVLNWRYDLAFCIGVIIWRFELASWSGVLNWRYDLAF